MFYLGIFISDIKTKDLSGISVEDVEIIKNRKKDGGFDEEKYYMIRNFINLCYYAGNGY